MCAGYVSDVCRTRAGYVPHEGRGTVRRRDWLLLVRGVQCNICEYRCVPDMCCMQECRMCVGCVWGNRCVSDQGWEVGHVPRPCVSCLEICAKYGI